MTRRGARANSRTRAFTLIELIVVIAIIGVLVTLTCVATVRMTAQSRATGCVSNLRQLGMALSAYLGEHDNVMPELQAGRRDKNDPVPVLDNTLDRYLQDARVFGCPADNAGLFAGTGTSYFWNTVLNGQSLASLSFLTIQDLSRIPLISDKQGFHPYQTNHVNILFADGHASRELQFFVGN